MPASKIFVPNRSLGYVSNHLPLQVRYIKSRKEHLIVTCVGKTFHTYGISHFGLLSVGNLHPEDITCITADTYHVYTACDGIIHAWRRGTELKHTYSKHSSPVHTMVPFGPHLIAVDESSRVKVWDIKAETVFLELTFSNDTFRITAALHPSTYVNKILFGSERGEMQLWNLNKSKMVYAFKGWPGSSITVLEQAPALDVIAVGLNSGKIVLHNLKYDQTIMDFVQDFGPVTAISFRTDGPAVMASGSPTGHIVFWDLEERKVHSILRAAHDSSVSGLQFLPNEPTLLSSSPDNTLKLWIFDMSDGGARLLRKREGHSSSPNFVRFHGANGQNVLSAGNDSTLRIFNTQTEQFNKSLGKASYRRKVSKKRGRGVEDPLKMPPIVEFTAETTREKEWDNIGAVHLGLAMVTTWSYDKIKMGELKLVPERFQKKNRDWDVDVVANCLSLTHCGNFLVVGYSTGHVDRFNIQSGNWRESYGQPKAHNSPVRGVAVDELNQVVVTGCSEGEIKFWKFKNKELKTPLAAIQLEESIHFFRLHRQSSMLAVALEDFSVIIVDVDTKRIVRKFHGHTSQLTDIAFSPDSRWLVTASMDCSIRTWDIPASQLVDEFATDSACISLTMSPTGESLASAHVDNLGIFLWTNRTLYMNVSLKAMTPSAEPELIALPQCRTEFTEEDIEIKEEVDEFLSPEQISGDLVTLSGLATSRWQNLLNIDVIKKRNKPKEPPKAPKLAPFFLPTLQSLNFQFDLTSGQESGESQGSRLLVPESLVNLTAFGKLLNQTKETNDFQAVVEKLKSLGPSMIDFEIKSLAPEDGGTITVLLQFLRCIEYMLKSNCNFELAESYLSVFLKAHGNTIARSDELRTFLPNIQSCHNVVWNRLQNKLMYSICVVRNLKTM